eukprot:CFRG2420T1
MFTTAKWIFRKVTGYVGRDRDGLSNNSHNTSNSRRYKRRRSMNSRSRDRFTRRSRSTDRGRDRDREKDRERERERDRASRRHSVTKRRSGGLTMTRPPQPPRYRDSSREGDRERDMESHGYGYANGFRRKNSRQRSLLNSDRSVGRSGGHKRVRRGDYAEHDGRSYYSGRDADSTSFFERCRYTPNRRSHSHSRQSGHNNVFRGGGGIRGGSRRGRERSSRVRREDNRERSRRRRRDYITKSNRRNYGDGGGDRDGSVKRGKTSKRQRKQSCDDEQGRLIVKIGSHLYGSRYEILRELGEGTFGKVLECYDNDLMKKVAVKVIKNVPKYRDAAKIEIDILEALTRYDKKRDSGVIHMLSSFDYRNHICMVFDVLGENVYEFIKDNGYRGMPFHQVQAMSQQLLMAVKFIHSIRLTHTDLKPENILFVNSHDYSELKLPASRISEDKDTKPRSGKLDDDIKDESRRESEEDTSEGEDRSENIEKGCESVKVLHDPSIRLIDFGSATWEDQHHTAIVATRHYRPPEVILELGWAYPCDIWSVGCIMFELYTGDALFQTHDSLEHLAMMEVILDRKIPTDMVKGTKKDKLLDSSRTRIAWPEKAADEKAVTYVKENCHPLQEMMHEKTEKHSQFLDLIQKMLEYRPEDRITASEALKHQYFDSEA